MTPFKPEPVTVVGAGLAGCEAAWQLARRGVPVTLIDMKPGRRSAAHHEDGPAELVCSNSFKSDQPDTAAGCLKAELRRLGSLLLTCADETRLPAGTALAVDRVAFSAAVDDHLRRQPLITRHELRVERVPEQGIRIIATGPLTDEALAADISRLLGVGPLHFYDAAAPIVSAESIDRSVAFAGSRYGRGGEDYWNCPLDSGQYDGFVRALLDAAVVEPHAIDGGAVFEACMPLETMAARGMDALRFGPLRPVGLTDPRSGRRPYACLQLRQDDRAASLYNLVGCQTRLTWPEQRRVFRLVPGLSQAEFVRYGVIHRNTYLPSPQVLRTDGSARGQSGLYFAGQLTGVEGYVESIASGWLAGTQAAARALGIPEPDRQRLIPDLETIGGALARYISDPAIRDFQPMNANFGLLPVPPDAPRKREQRRAALTECARRATDRLYYDLQRIWPEPPESGAGLPRGG